MRLITWRTLHQFCVQHAEVRDALASWRGIVENARWTRFQDILNSFPNAENLGQGRVKFKIHGNRYRLLADVRYASADPKMNGIVKVQFIGTHAEYDKINAKTIVFRRD